MAFGIKDFIDILLVALMMFWCYRLLRKSGVQNLFWGIIFIVTLWYIVSRIFNLTLTGALFNYIVEVGALALIIIFQDEVRAFFYSLGSQLNISALRHRFLPKEQEDATRFVSRVVVACGNMQKTKTGALIVIEGDEPLREYMDTGERLDARVSARLIENIFFKNTPLHDGALIISHGRLNSAACILPVSKNTDIPLQYGLRHRAALGLAEKSDALVLVVSEETGHVSVAQKGQIREVSVNELTQIITSFVLR